MYLFHTEDDSNDSTQFDNIVEEGDDLDKYRAVCEYSSQEAGQISFSEGDIIAIVDKDEDGKFFFSWVDATSTHTCTYLQ